MKDHLELQFDVSYGRQKLHIFSLWLLLISGIFYEDLFIGNYLGQVIALL
jgi:hypothetical protein